MRGPSRHGYRKPPPHVREIVKYIERLKTEQAEFDLISAGSSLKFFLVAEGRADVYPLCPDDGMEH